MLNQPILTVVVAVLSLVLAGKAFNLGTARVLDVEPLSIGYVSR